MSRPATHAGSWYSKSASKLQQQINEWLSMAKPPLIGRYAVGPHAGLAYCGEVLAQTYAALDPSVSTIFIMGPSHVKYFRGFQTTAYHDYKTPLGESKIARHIVDKLIEAGIKPMDPATDLKEHGIEMHVPFVQTVNPAAAIVPLVFGDCDSKHEQLAIELLRPYFNDPQTAFVVSSDFCHWGEPFDYFAYYASPESSLTSISPTTKVAQPIYKSIEQLDRQAMDIASTGSSQKWNSYIAKTGNTICGQRPLGVLMALAESENCPLSLQWMGYKQSSKVDSVYEMSVSYASSISS